MEDFSWDCLPNETIKFFLITIWLKHLHYQVSNGTFKQSIWERSTESTCGQ